MNDALESRMAERKLAHAYLITGTNRRRLADRLAAAWVCTGDRPPCGVCPGCRKAAAGIHPDIRRYEEPAEDRKNYQIKEIRALRADAWIMPNEAPRKVYLIARAELLTAPDQNVLLKLVEEGPDYARFLFLSPNPELLLPTVRSRCELLRAPGEETDLASQDGETLAGFFLSGAGPAESLPFLVSLEKRDRQEIGLLLEETAARLTRALPQRPELLAALDRLAPIRAACEFNIGAGHLAGWIAAALGDG